MLLEIELDRVCLISQRLQLFFALKPHLLDVEALFLNS